MGIEQDLQSKLNNNQRTIFITEADELLAAWLYKRRHTGRRSLNLNAVPTKFRLSCPPNDKVPLVPCHVTTRHHQGKMITGIVKPKSIVNCHGHKGATAPHIESVPLNDIIPLVDSPLEAVRLAKDSAGALQTPIMDGFTLARICKELGFHGKAIPKVINHRQYLALTGYAGQRSILRGTLYKPTHPQIVKMGIGTHGIRSGAVKGGLWTIYLTVPFTIAEHFLRDPKCHYQLFGEIVVDVSCATISAAAFWFFATGLTIATGGSIFIPLAIASGIAFVTGMALKDINNNYGVSTALSNWLKKLREGEILYNGKMRHYTATKTAAVRRTGQTGLWAGI